MSNLLTKLTNVQRDLKAPKNQKNTFGKYNYRSCEDILEAVKPLCVACGLALTLSDEIKLIGDRFYVEATAMVTDVETGESHKVTALAREPDIKKGCDVAQITGGSSSYARKYALNGLFCIDDTKDADTQAPPKSVNNAPKKVVNNQLTSTINEIGTKITELTSKGSKPDDIKTAIKAGGHVGKYAMIKDLATADKVLTELNKIK